MGNDDFAPPPGPPPGHAQQPMSQNNPYRNAASGSSSGAPPAYEPPSGAPPGWAGDKKSTGNEDYLPPPGPPPSHFRQDDEYAPPPGPPPSHHQTEKDVEPPPYDPWMAVPDSSYLPPPPSFKHDERSPGANASWDDAAKGHDWCRKTPLWPAQSQSSDTLERIRAGDIYLTTPPLAHNARNIRNIQLTRLQGGRTHIRTSPHTSDTIFLSDIPVYPALSPSKPRTIYFELRVLAMSTTREEAGIALGFLAPPYPSWRLPGWHRASIGVHGDDGRRYADDSYGGVDFVKPFDKGDMVGVGMTFSPGMGVGGKNRVECFFTRNGRKEGGWDLNEEVDQKADVGNVEGLEGSRDVLAAVGCFGGIETEVIFASSGWRFRPEGM